MLFLFEQCTERQLCVPQSIHDHGISVRWAIRRHDVPRVASRQPFCRTALMNCSIGNRRVCLWLCSWKRRCSSAVMKLAPHFGPVFLPVQGSRFTLFLCVMDDILHSSFASNFISLRGWWPPTPGSGCGLVVTLGPGARKQTDSRHGTSIDARRILWHIARIRALNASVQGSRACTHGCLLLRHTCKHCRRCNPNTPIAKNVTSFELSLCFGIYLRRGFCFALWGHC